jgi:D-alanine transaminase
VAYARPLTFAGPEQRRRGVTTIIVPDLRWLRCDIKSVNLLGNVMARQRCRQHGADEALLVRDGVVREGAHANLFAVLDGTVVTHPADQSILRGTVRGQVMKLAAGAGFRVAEQPLAVSDLDRAQELFLTSTTLGVMPIRWVNGKEHPPGPVAWRLGELLEEFETS